MTTVRGMCGVRSHILQFWQKNRRAGKIVCDKCFREGYFGNYICEVCGYLACERCASVFQAFVSEGRTSGGQVEQSLSGSNPVPSRSSSSPQQPLRSSRAPNRFSRSVDTIYSEARQPRTSALSSGRRYSNPTTTQDRTPDAGQGQARRTVRERPGERRGSWAPSEPEVSYGSVQRKKSVHAAQSSSSRPWEYSNDVSNSDSDDLEQSLYARSLVSGLDDEEVSEEEEDDDDDDEDEKLSVIPCAGSIHHELEYLQESPYYHLSLNNSYGCNMCYKAGSNDLYHCEICQFDTHKACAEIQEEVEVFFHKHLLQRDLMDEEEFTCRFCVGDTEPDIRPWVYRCLDCPNFIVHARCAKYAKSLKHPSHPHKLKLVQNPVIGEFSEVCCDACCNSIHQGYHYTCSAKRCDFDLHPSCAILPSAPLCRLDGSHRLKLDYMASEPCFLCGDSGDDEIRWMYRCEPCDVSMDIDCFNLDLGDSDEEFSGSDEELSDGDEGPDKDFGELYQTFLESVEDFGNQGSEEQVDKLSELVDSFKNNTKTRPSLVRQYSVSKPSLNPKISTPAPSVAHFLDDGFAKMSLGESSRSEVRNSDDYAEEEERRRAKQAAKELKIERRREKAEMKALEEKDRAAYREKVASEMQSIASKLQNIQNHQQSGGNDAATARQVAELQASIESLKASDVNWHEEQSKLHHERHQEYMSGQNEIIRTQVHLKTRAVPRLVLCSETTSKSRKLLTVLRVGLKGVRLDLLCEHKEQPHVVQGAPGCEMNQKVAGDRWSSLQPFLAAGVLIVTSAVNYAGMGALSSVLPDINQKVWDIQAVDLGKHAVPTGRNKQVARPKSEPGADESAAEWLKVYLKNQNINIAEAFKLYRVRYKAPDHMKGTVSWLCRDHLDKGVKDHVLHPFP